jgi:hypothetical protein
LGVIDKKRKYINKAIIAIACFLVVAITIYRMKKAETIELLRRSMEKDPGTIGTEIFIYIALISLSIIGLIYFTQAIIFFLRKK